MGELFSKEDFVELCYQIGYASRRQALIWCAANPKDLYTDADFMEVHRSVTEPSHGGYKDGWRELGDGSRATISEASRDEMEDFFPCEERSDNEQHDF